jgi:hypothetical protein
MKSLHMHRPLARRARFVAGVVAITLGLVSSASCLAGSVVDVQEPQHACCPAMAGDCGSVGTLTENCCAAEQPGLTGFAPAAPFTLAAPVAISAVLLAPPTSVPPLTSPGFDPDASNPISPPTHLLDSVFRI